MGRTYVNKREFDDSDRQQKIKGKSLKHSRNIPGKGMRVINNWSEEEYDDEYETSYETDDEYYDNTSSTQRK
jgi:hypothetical protein